MNFIIHNQGKFPVAELERGSYEINTVQDALDLMAEADYRGARRIIIYKEQMCPEFFELRSGVAGEILQKFSIYSMRLAIVGDLAGYNSKSLNDFIYESNKTGRILFLSTADEAINKLSS